MAKSCRCLLPADNICPALIEAQREQLPGLGRGRKPARIAPAKGSFSGPLGHEIWMLYGRFDEILPGVLVLVFRNLVFFLIIAPPSRPFLVRKSRMFLRKTVKFPLI